MQPPVKKQPVIIPCDNKRLKGELSIPGEAYGLVLFAHGCGCGRFIPRDRIVADFLNGEGIATLLFDLLTPDEYMDFDNRFNIPLLTKRLKIVTQWALQQQECKEFPIGYFGVSTGPAAALKAAMELPQVKTVVSSGGRPDLAVDALPNIKASALFIVGELDGDVLKQNKKAFDYLDCDKKLEVVPGATHLFKEKGAMESVCSLAGEWFENYLQPLKQLK